MLLGITNMTVLLTRCTTFFAGKSFTACDTCRGDGRVRKTKRIKLTVPAGVEDGTRLRVTGEGNAGRRGGPSGDLYVYMSVAPSPDMRREGMTIYSDVEVRFLGSIIPKTN